MLLYVMDTLYRDILGICALNECGINISKDLVVPMTIPYIVSTLVVSMTIPYIVSTLRLFHARNSTRFEVINTYFDLLVPTDKYPRAHATIM